MSAATGTRRLGKWTTLAAASLALGALAMPLQPASAQVYLGWDFGNGFGIGLGAPPSAYERCPNYGLGPEYCRPPIRPPY